MNKYAVFAGIVFSCWTSGLLAQSSSACTAMLTAQIPGSNLQISQAQHYLDRSIQARGPVPVVLPAHCHLEGELDRRTGVNGKSYALRFSINMPDDWNGRFMFQGGGGLNGTLNEPVGNQATGNTTALARGFAVVSTDSGHEANGGFDASFREDQEALLNFLFLGNMRVTLVAKPLVELYYRKDISKAYFVGCSTGGREGMIMAQRFPLLYDGIISGAPAIRTGLSNLALRWMNVKMNLAAAKDADGLPLPGGTYSKEEQKLVIDGLLARCDALDGLSDGLIFNTVACDFDPRTLACPAGQSEGCLSPAKAQALVAAVAGPVDSRGVQLYPRFILDTGIDDVGFIPGIIAGGGGPPVGPSVAAMLTQDIDAEFTDATAFDNALGDSTSLNVSSFAANGGKHIFYHGVSDPWFSAVDTIEYYQGMAAVNGGLQTVDNFSRVFLVPGMGHCAGGQDTLDTFDLLTPLVDWVENAKAPEAVVASGTSMPGVTRPLCPYPEYPEYSGSGDVNSAANFSCKL